MSAGVGNCAYKSCSQLTVFLLPRRFSRWLTMEEGNDALCITKWRYVRLWHRCFPRATCDTHYATDSSRMRVSKEKKKKKKKKGEENGLEIPWKTIEILYRRIFIDWVIERILMSIIFLRTFRNSFFLIKLRSCKFVFSWIQSKE